MYVSCPSAALTKETCIGWNEILNINLVAVLVVPVSHHQNFEFGLVLDTANERKQDIFRNSR